MLSYLNWNFALSLGYLNPALNNPSSRDPGADSGGKGKTKRAAKNEKEEEEEEEEEKKKEEEK